MVSTDLPPHGLQLVIEFVNTRSIEQATDAIDTPTRLSSWLVDHGLLAEGSQPGTADDVLHAAQVREGLRAALLAHTRGEAERLAPLERAARRGQLSVAFGEATARIVPRAAGIDGALASLLAPVARSTLDGTWQRMKACDAPDCLEAFYDRSRNHAGRWCDMAVCGNRTKVRAYRAKRG